jgi:tetratricopeptide (TPR) repeat protein
VPERKAAAERTHGAERPARATIDAALAWLRARDPERPFFLWVHLYDAHDPYTPPVDFAQRFSTPYLGEVAAADHELGRLFETLRSSGRFDETFIVALADHGEAFGEHGEVTHGTFCYETTLHIPLLARWPKSSPARRTGVSSELVSAVDIAPTLLEALALPPLDGVDGLSFYSRALPAERGIYFESYYGYLSCGWSPLTGWLDARGKYIHSSEPEFYDWRADPRELTDLASARAGALAPYRDSIARLADAPALASAAVNGDAETLARIQALGYASSGESDGELPHPLAPNTLASPRSQASFFLKQARAKERLAQRDPAGAAEIYREVLRESPNNFFALEELGTLATELGKTDEAIPLLTRLAHEGPQRGRYYHKLGLALMAAKRFEDALVPLLHAAELTGGRPRYLEALRDAYARLGRAEEMAAIEARFQEKN